MIPNHILNELIEKSKHEEVYKISACLYKGGNIVNISVNTKQYIGYRKNKFKFEPTRHAEVNVIHNINRDIIAESTLAVIRTNAYDMLTCAKPCYACIKIIKESGISKLIYSDYSGNLIRINPQTIDLELWEKEKPSDQYIEETTNLKYTKRRRH